MLRRVTIIIIIITGLSQQVFLFSTSNKLERLLQAHHRLSERCYQAVGNRSVLNRVVEIVRCLRISIVG